MIHHIEVLLDTFKELILNSTKQELVGMAANCKANNESKVMNLLQFGLRVCLMVQDKTLAHVSMLMSLVFCRYENRENA